MDRSGKYFLDFIPFPGDNRDELIYHQVWQTEGRAVQKAAIWDGMARYSVLEVLFCTHYNKGRARPANVLWMPAPRS